MIFKGRTVFVFVLLTMFATSLLTVTLVNTPIFANQGERMASSMAAEGLTKQEFEKINTTLKLIESRFYSDVDRTKVIDGAINGMMSSLQDPYSVYMDKEVADEFSSSSIEGAFTGIGAEVTLEDGKVTVVSPIKGSPAERAGIMAKDVLISVNGEKLEGLKLNDAVAKIRGPKGTKAKILVKRAGVAEPIEYVVVREEIDLETVYAQMLPDKIGLIEISQFSMKTAKRFGEELKNLESQGMKGLVIDVRNNPGGVVPVLIEIAEHFVPKGKVILQMENREGKREQQLSKGSSKPYPVTVLINKGSASAAEILAVALQENHVGTLVGETSFGKGTVQVSYTEELRDGSLLKMTIAKWLTPDGNWIHHQGVKPDIEIKPPDYYYAVRLSKERDLAYDMNNDDVKNAQVMLDALGMKPGRKDGYFSQQTKSAVEKFQRQNGLHATGVINSETAEKLEDAVRKLLEDPKSDVQLNKAVEVLRKEIR
ncbi:S41 family peptidase [Paenibacillus sp. CECT 9249]|uniref:S41 family peptidase n=1 Tax=unclassified Paenibacillus TaxID=185978 RepID=UPI001E53E03C|nr:S41 family peptidase [Paenibacillus sp. CECT 9249]CAH0121822.1 Carboxy-terminal processing protease CtpB [Paenibacillus sp. CECT 9249]